MSDYGKDPEDIHESMHMYRHERHYKGHKLSRGIGLNKIQRGTNKQVQAHGDKR